MQGKYLQIPSQPIIVFKAQYTSPTRLSCRVESRRRCVLNSQIVSELSCVGKFVQTRRDSRRLVANSVHTADGSMAAESRRRRRRVLGTNRVRRARDVSSSRLVSASTDCRSTTSTRHRQTADRARRRPSSSDR